MRITDKRVAPAVWSNIAEPGDAWAGALRRELGVRPALEWALAPFTAPAFPGPHGETDQAAAKGWRAAHRRWAARLQVIDWRSDLKTLADMGGRLVIPSDDEWPAALNDLQDKTPPALWVLGSAPLSDHGPAEPTVSIVGSRAATSYGAKLAGEMAFDLGEQQVTVVSGGAYGIDAAAHRGALDSWTLRKLEAPTSVPGGFISTVAVVCGGLKNLYPPGNKRLFKRILNEGGSIVAEVPPTFRPARWRFLERNRLIAAWSKVTVIVEAGARSGALATANRAVEIGREVAAMPGPVTSAASVGPHMLLKDGAALVENAADILALVDPTRTEDLKRQQDPSRSHDGLPGVTEHVSRTLSGLHPLAKRVWEALPLMGAAETLSIARAAGLSEGEADSGLLTLHLAGLAENEGQKWRRTAA